ncbi:hypothetical protein IMG5_168240 [Ichthyophthirius multifiliis]|uniref:Uncharacterized protein n=1 Tax=Ichthyophthirius multifiliis TaxID=5932 RepID=G0R121_ICHMU|nr:hypothetical protein IMG5_168240 [Ichthyophthirius multifiliis]EGR28788.1 hypothetical protein IMG5_168240 [Ichthyophthirius multifiliis]|eukprot:XP_004030024.1 hypothetical protein IMG5_168240 [Ichthyophthirius multifiliis]
MVKLYKEKLFQIKKEQNIGLQWELNQHLKSKNFYLILIQLFLHYQNMDIKHNMKKSLYNLEILWVQRFIDLKDLTEVKFQMYEIFFFFLKKKKKKFIDQEEEMKLMRQLQMQNEIIKQIAKPDTIQSLQSKEIKEELNQMQKELASYNDQINEINAGRRRVLIEKINRLFTQMIRAEKKQNYVQQIKDESQIYKENVDEKVQLRRVLEKNRLMQKIQQQELSVDEKIDQFTPISRNEFKDFLVDKGYSEAKAEKVLREFYQKEDQAFKINATEEVNKFNEIANIENLNAIHKFKYKKNQKMIFPLPNSVMPRPILGTYDGKDYYDIPQIFEPTQQGNKVIQQPILYLQQSLFTTWTN